MTALTKDEHAKMTKLTVDQKLQCLNLAIESLKQGSKSGIDAEDVVMTAEHFTDFISYDSIQSSSTFFPDASNTDKS